MNPAAIVVAGGRARVGGIAEVLDRLAIDPGFRRQLEEDPRSALRPFELCADDLDLLVEHVLHTPG